MPGPRGCWQQRGAWARRAGRWRRPWRERARLAVEPGDTCTRKGAAALTVLLTCSPSPRLLKCKVHTSPKLPVPHSAFLTLVMRVNWKKVCLCEGAAAEVEWPGEGAGSQQRKEAVMIPGAESGGPSRTRL